MKSSLVVLFTFALLAKICVCDDDSSQEDGSDEILKNLKKNVSSLWSFVRGMRQTVDHDLHRLHQHQNEIADQLNSMLGIDLEHVGGHMHHMNDSEHQHVPGGEHDHRDEHHGDHHDEHHDHHHDGHHEEHHGEHHDHHSDGHHEEHHGEHHDHHDDGHHEEHHGDSHGHHEEHHSDHHGEHHDGGHHEEHHDHHSEHHDDGHQGEQHGGHHDEHHNHHVEHHHGDDQVHRGHEHDHNESESEHHQQAHAGHSHDEHHGADHASNETHREGSHHHHHHQECHHRCQEHVNHHGHHHSHHHHHGSHLNPSKYDLAVCIVEPNRAIPEEKQQNVTGKISLWQKKNGTTLHLHIKVKGFKVDGEHQAGEHTHSGHSHGFHIHQEGDLSNGCQSTGPHFNPTGVLHGGPSAPVRHVGDLGNIECNEHGVTNVMLTDHVASLHGEHSIIGKSLVIHERNDDLGANPDNPASVSSGDAGIRIACCLIQRVDRLSVGHAHNRSHSHHHH